jgi:PleD family two-component response regulator
MQPVILAIDDAPEVLITLSSMLKEDYDVRVAKTAVSAFAVLRQEEVSLILLDIEMPRMSGFEFLVYINTRSEYRGIPVIFVSSDSDTETVTNALKRGASGYIVKPFTKETLKEKVIAVLDAARR